MNGYLVGAYIVLFVMLSVVRKMALYMADILEPEDKERLHENLLVGPAKVIVCNNFQVHVHYNSKRNRLVRQTSFQLWVL